MRRVLVVAGLVVAAVAIPDLVAWRGGRIMLADGIPAADIFTDRGP
jgi:hypothetical protein